MTSFKTVTLVTLSIFIASTSLASALGTVKQVEKPRIEIDRGPVYEQSDPKPILDPGIVIDVNKPIPINPGFIAKTDAIDPKALALDCEIKTSAPTTDDFWIVNVGEADLPSGLKILFSVPSTDDSGAFLLPRSVKTGEKVKIADLLDDAQSGAPCKATIL